MNKADVKALHEVIDETKDRANTYKEANYHLVSAALGETANQLLSFLESRKKAK